MVTNLEKELAENIRKVLAKKDFTVLELLAEINTFLEERKLGRLIIVGGYAVEIYSGSAYRTGDIDLVVEGGVEVLRNALGIIEKWNGRVWFTQGLKYALDIVSTLYSKPKKPIKIRVNDKSVYIEPPEETIISCLNACVYWQSDIDCEKVAMVLAAQWNRLDWKYLEKRAREEGVLEKFYKIRQVVEKVIKTLS